MKKVTPKKQAKKKLSLRGAKMIDGLHTNDDVKRYIGAVTEHFEHQVSAVAEQFGSVQQKLDSHTEMIGRLMIDVQEIKNDLKQKVNRDEFAHLEKRVLALEIGRGSDNPRTTLVRTPHR